MYSFPCVSSHQKIDSLFKTITNSEVPDKFTYRYLAKLGFSSSRDRDLLPMLKDLKLIDQKGRPTNYYTDLRDPRYKKEVLKKCISIAYKKLFDLDTKIPDVQDELLQGYFSKLTGESKSRSEIHTNTFKELVRIADYQADHQNKKLSDNKSDKNEDILYSLNPQESNQPTQQKVNININIPETTNGEVYRELFKHLKGLLNP